MDIAPANDEAIEAWNTILFEKFTAYRAALGRVLGPHGEDAMRILDPQPGHRVVDIGCGFGDTTLRLADRVGARGCVVGIDAADRYLAVARTEAAQYANVEYVAADVELGVPGGPYDLAFARMGTMFFNQPVFALRHIRRALVPGGRFAMSVWRKKPSNEVLYVAENAVRGLLGEPEKGDQVTCGPGPFSMASADLVTDQMLAAGFTDVAVTRSDSRSFVAGDLDSAVRFAMDLGPAGEIVRLAGEVAKQRRAEIEHAVRDALAPYVTAEGIVGPTSAWVVTGRAPHG